MRGGCVFIQILRKWTGDVEFFVYDLKRRIYSQAGQISHGLKNSWLCCIVLTHRDEKKHHARQGEATGVAKIALIAMRKMKVMYVTTVL